jgi:Family of unknown function (DUF5715)
MAFLFMRKRIVIVFLICAVLGVAVWATVRFTRSRRLVQSITELPAPPQVASAEAWAEAVAKVKEDRPEGMGGGIDIPPELKHYSERYWFLATQVAEVDKHNIYTCQDFLDLAAMIERGELVPVPPVTDSYVLFGVGERADESEFTRYENEQNIELNNEAQVFDRQKLFREYESLQTLAKNFLGRSYNLQDPVDRQALKLNMLRSLRPPALKILEEVAAAYQRQFNRPLHVSSLVRPEQYQRQLRRVNRNAVLIDTPPHSTGLAFDIDYRYMTAAEQTFVMAELARVKNEGRIEVIRERNANYHVFAFIDGMRPGDDLITASLEKVKPPVEEAHHGARQPAKVKRAAKRHRKHIKK